MSFPTGALTPSVHERDPSAAVVHSVDVLLTSNEFGGGVGSTESVFNRVKLTVVVAAFTVLTRREMLEFPGPGIFIANEAGARPEPAGGAVVTGADVMRAAGVPELAPPPPQAASAAPAASAPKAKRRCAVRLPMKFSTQGPETQVSAAVGAGFRYSLATEGTLFEVPA